MLRRDCTRPFLVETNSSTSNANMLESLVSRGILNSGKVSDVTEYADVTEEFEGVTYDVVS